MTTLVANRVFPTNGGPPKTVPMVVPVARATDAEFDAFFCEQLREFLHRHGYANALGASDGVLLESMRGLFALPR